MKTHKNSNPTLPSPVKFSFYIIAVAVLGILNWTALKASDTDKAEANTLKARLEAALVPVTEPAIELEDWMLSFYDEVAFEAELALEDWMLNVDDVLIADYADSEIELEDWMLSVDENLIADFTESEIALEDWMLIVPDPAPAIEDWMVNSETWAKVDFLATK